MHVLFATAEFAPLARVGGLAAAAAGLVAELRSQGVTVDVVIPDYFATGLAGEQTVELPVPRWAAPATARRGVAPGVGEITLIDVPGIRRPNPYVQPDGEGFPDNDQRFFAFSAAVAALARRIGPDVVHLNDWHTATTLAHLDPPIPSVLTAHTLGYQGWTDAGWVRAFPNRPEAFLQEGACNPLLGGIRLADVVITVSPNYAREALTGTAAPGLEDALADRGERFVGIRNGIDTTEWDPAADPRLPEPFDSTDTAGKLGSKRAVQAELGLQPNDDALITVVTRLVDQKGIDLVVPALAMLATMPAQLAVLGDGARDLVNALHAAVEAHPGIVGFRQGYDEVLAHRMFAGGDVFLMPSRFEPCGLAQMQAMRYGALPMVTNVGGLPDTVVDIDDTPRAGTGVIAHSVSVAGVVDGLHRAVRAWGVPARRGAMRRRGMRADWSWNPPARAHIAWYEEIAAPTAG